MRFLANHRVAKNDTHGCRSSAYCMRNEVLFIYVSVNCIFPFIYFVSSSCRPFDCFQESFFSGQISAYDIIIFCW